MHHIFIHTGSLEHDLSVETVVQDFLASLRVTHKIHRGMAIENVLSQVEKYAHTFDVFVLDATSSACVRLASAIRKKNLIPSILFFAENRKINHSLIAYRPSGFIFAPVTQEGVLRVFRHAYMVQSCHAHCMTIRTKQTIYKIPFSQIDYLENYQRIVTLHSASLDLNVDFYAKFDEVYGRLPAVTFLRCHQSVVVNLGAVLMLDRPQRQFLLRSGERVDISKSFYSDSVQRFTLFQSALPTQSSDYV